MSEGTKTLDVGSLAQRVAELERIVAILTKERDARQPFGPIPSQPTIAPQYPFIPVMPAVSANPRCGKCNIELAPIMGYCCPHTDCPCGLGGFSCTTAA
jgi:hypothetical protein